ncbi:fluoride efflux transporter CrcB [Limnoglobus roseus]|uniref:Fluoride-specific ion channel FluC n=1 Tax=Limnoglobus roseus TaxID=2598579 RepID=A0A5C1A6H6_9BACT|nr:fluoride efflux transporter CrcB [Limnoglobus roseus]QEL13596.1 fluoride efflux transporter CrcB [Limnoglobus roseus]
MQTFLIVMLGGGLGANARFWLGVWFKDRGWTEFFPWHTFLINVLGSFVLGVVAMAYEHRPAWYHFLGVGICGGFTTFSTFSLETLVMMEKDRWLAATGYAVGSVLAGIFGAWFGMKLARGA